MNVAGSVHHREVTMDLGAVELKGTQAVPEQARGLVIFAHGSGSSRLSPRNLQVARTLLDSGLGTLLFDLLTRSESEEDSSRFHRFDIAKLTDRLVRVIDWTRQDPVTAGLNVGLFGASTGAAAALAAAASRPKIVRAVVSRGGRPDLAAHILAEVQSPVLMIVGGNDLPVIQFNRQAASMMRCDRQIKIIPGAGHLFEEPGTLEQVANLAADFFMEQLPRNGSKPAER